MREIRGSDYLGNGRHIEVPTFLNLSKIFVYYVKKQLIECEPGDLFLKACLAFKFYHSL